MSEEQLEQPEQQLEPAPKKHRYTKKDYLKYLKPDETLQDPPPPGFRTVKYNALKQRHFQATTKGTVQERKAGREAEALRYDSNQELSKKDAREILGKRIHNHHVLDVVVELAFECAAANKLVPNLFFFTNGFQKTKESFAAQTDTRLESSEGIVPSECIHLSDLYCIWDFGVSHREPDIAFDGFIELRRKLKSDWIELGRVLGIPFEDKPHRGWQKFLPSFVPGLQPDYTLQDQQDWLAKQKSQSYPVEVRDFLLQASRNTMKSTAVLTLAVQAVLCAPGLRILLVSETNKLSRDFIKAFRGMWERGSNPAYERFQYLFPEYTIGLGEGSVLSFTSPMRNFVLPQETAEAASYETAVAGRRVDLLLQDDPVSDKSVGNDDMRLKGFNTHSALVKLREAGGAGIVISLGTPWTQGETYGDLYYELMKRNDPDALAPHRRTTASRYMSQPGKEHPLAVFVEPAWILKPTSAHLFPDSVSAINESHIGELTCPSRWPLKELLKEARANIEMFKSQNLCLYTETEQSKWQTTYTLEELEAAVKPRNFFESTPIAMTVAAVDAANSTSIVADKSSICIARIIPYQGKNVCFVVEVIAGRWRYPDLAKKFAEACQYHGVTRAVVERNNIPWEEFLTAVYRHFNVIGYPAPAILLQLSRGIQGSGVPAKMRRIKGTQTLLENNQLYFAYGDWNEQLFREMVRFKGQRSGSSDGSKDDMVDSLGMLTSTYLMALADLGLKKSEEQIKAEIDLERERFLKAQHDFIFNYQQPQATINYGGSPSIEESVGGVLGTLSRFGFTRGDTRNPFPRKVS